MNYAEHTMTRIRKQRKQHRQFYQKIALAVLVGGFVVVQLYYVSTRKGLRHTLRGPPRERWVTSKSQAFNTNGVATAAKHLIIVAGHSVTIAGHLEDANQDEHDWFLLDYQRHRGMPDGFVAHIVGGIQAADQDPTSLLVFSGGQTRQLTGPISEGSSYFRVADAMTLWRGNVRARAVAEEFATDSFENLLFSMCRFREVTGSYPEEITMVSFSFKQRRFESMHANALRLPPHRFHYIGIDPTSPEFDLETAREGELQNAAKPFEQDPYGCHSSVLQQKRKERNPFFRTVPYTLSCPEMKGLLQYCGPERVPAELVPWRDLS